MAAGGAKTDPFLFEPTTRAISYSGHTHDIEIEVNKYLHNCECVEAETIHENLFVFSIYASQSTSQSFASSARLRTILGSTLRQFPDCLIVLCVPIKHMRIFTPRVTKDNGQYEKTSFGFFRHPRCMRLVNVFLCRILCSTLTQVKQFLGSS